MGFFHVRPYAAPTPSGRLMTAASKRIRTPMFIVGAPRSGTTLLRVTLNRHSELAVCGETHFFARLYNRRNAFGDPANTADREQIVGAYLSIEPLHRLGMDLGNLRSRLLMDGVSWRALFATVLDEYALSTGKAYAGEKTPAHALHVKTLGEWFPNCTIIHLVRDPRAVVASLRNVPWASRSVLVGVRTWREFNSAAAAISTRENYIRVKYEDLVARPAEQLERICSHVGLEYQEGMLRADPAEYDAARPVARAWKEITPSRRSLWRQELEPWQVAAIETTVGGQMESYGYERETARVPASAMMRASIEATVEMSFLKVFRFPSALYRRFRPTHLADEQKWIRWSSTMYGRARLRRPAAAP